MLLQVAHHPFLLRQLVNALAFGHRRHIGNHPIVTAQSAKTGYHNGDDDRHEDPLVHYCP
ncbi:hypothetical protein D3C79_762920 [compost metagenome]